MSIERGIDFERGHREEEWQQMVEKMERTRDALGKPMDREIIETVAGMRLAGHETCGSCGGHPDDDENPRFPYVAVKAPNEPAYRFVGEAEMVKGLAEKYGVSEESLRRLRVPEAYDEYVREQRKLFEEGETPEYLKWKEINATAGEKLKGLVERFNEGRSDGESGLAVNRSFPSWRVESMTAKRWLDERLRQRREGSPQALDAERRRAVAEQIRGDQRVFRELAEALKNEFMNG